MISLYLSALPLLDRVPQYLCGGAKLLGSWNSGSRAGKQPQRNEWRTRYSIQGRASITSPTYSEVCHTNRVGISSSNDFQLVALLRGNWLMRMLNSQVNIYIHKVYMSYLQHLSVFSLCFIPTMKWAALFCMPFCHDDMPHCKPRNKGTRCPWLETPKTVSQNKLLLLYTDFHQVFGHSDGKLIKTKQKPEENREKETSSKMEC